MYVSQRQREREREREKDAASSEGISSDEMILVLILLPLLAFDFNPCCHGNRRHDSEEQIGLLFLPETLRKKHLLYLSVSLMMGKREKSTGD